MTLDPFAARQSTALRGMGVLLLAALLCTLLITGNEGSPGALVAVLTHLCVSLAAAAAARGCAPLPVVAGHPQLTVQAECREQSQPHDRVCQLTVSCTAAHDADFHGAALCSNGTWLSLRLSAAGRPLMPSIYWPRCVGETLSAAVRFAGPRLSPDLVECPFRSAVPLSGYSARSRGVPAATRRGFARLALRCALRTGLLFEPARNRVPQWHLPRRPLRT